MRFKDSLSLSTRMFRSRPTRTWLTIFGISIGIGAVLFLVSLGYGLQNIILEKIVFNQAMLSITATPLNELIPFDDKATGELAGLPRVENVAPLATFTGNVGIGDLYGTVQIRGADAQFFDYSGVGSSVGVLYSEGERDVVEVSEAILKLFGVEDSESILGKEMSIKVFVNTRTEDGQNVLNIVELPQKFIIKGVAKDGQDSFIYVPLFQLKEYLSVPEYELARVKVLVAEDLVPVKDEIIARGYQVASLSDTVEQANKIFRIVQIVLGLFGAVALLVSAIGMFNTMTVTLMERTNEIGIMRALGASKKDLRNLFLLESSIIGFLGGVVGVIVGMVGGTIFNMGINSLAAKFGGAKVTLFVYPQWFLIAIVLISLGIGLLSGVFPARRAATIDPLEALRYK